MTERAAGLVWYLSAKLHDRRIPLIPRALKYVNYFLWRAILPPEAKLSSPVLLKHYGLGVVIHPNTTIGDRVVIYHGVTFAAESYLGSPFNIVIGDDVVVGAGAIIIARPDTGLTIGSGARIGAGAVVTQNVPARATVVGNPARLIERGQ